MGDPTNVLGDKLAIPSAALAVISRSAVAPRRELDARTRFILENCPD